MSDHSVEQELERNLTSAQQRVLDYLRDFIAYNGFSPSMRDLMDMAGLKSTSSVAYQLKQLEAKGYISRKSRTPRSIVLTEISTNEEMPSGQRH